MCHLACQHIVGGGDSGCTLFISFSFFQLYLYQCSCFKLNKLRLVIFLLFTILIDKDRKPLRWYSAHESDRPLIVLLNQSHVKIQCFPVIATWISLQLFEHVLCISPLFFPFSLGITHLLFFQPETFASSWNILEKNKILLAKCFVFYFPFVVDASTWHSIFWFVHLFQRQNSTMIHIILKRTSIFPVVLEA